MNTLNVRVDRAHLIQGDHQHLKARLERLHDQFASAALTRAQAERELESMEAELEEHFAHEESGGFFAEIVESSPELGERIRELLRQHQEFRVIFRSLRKTCRWACSKSGTRAGWLAEFADFHRRFDEHECAEHELLYQALQRDLGAGD